jgi:putative membrane protein
MTLALACNKQENTNTTATTDTSTSTAASATSTTATDTSGTTSTTGTGSATGTTAANLSKDDKEFVTKAAEAGNMEVSEGQLAGSKAADADVKNFGSTMVSDHGKAGDELKSLASSKGITLPTGPGKEGEDAINKLTSKNGKDFDKAYMKDAVDDHEKAVKLFEKESKDGQDPDLKAWAAKTLPTLQKHLDMAKATKKKVG